MTKCHCNEIYFKEALSNKDLQSKLGSICGACQKYFIKYKTNQDVKIQKV